jgi:hypothetical protein
MQRMREAVRRWWDGKAESADLSNEMFSYFSMWTTRHWTSRAAHAVIEFAGREWKWLIPVCLTCIGLCVAIARH